MNAAVLLELGLSPRLVEHLAHHDPDSVLGFAVQPPMHWRSSPIARRDIVPLWECGTTLSYFDRPSRTFRSCHLEDIATDRFQYRSIQALLAQLFIALYEDDHPDAALREAARQAGFAHVERLLREVADVDRARYGAWATAFPLSCEATER